MADNSTEIATTTATIATIATTAPAAVAQLPAPVCEWLESHNLAPAFYGAATRLPRYIRVNPRANTPITDIQASFAPALLSTTPLPSVYGVDGSASVCTNSHYRNGAVYGIDLASAVSCLSLMAPVSDSGSGSRHVLDLCAAPGAKLCYLYDLLSFNTHTINGNDNGNNSGRGSGSEWSVTGVDASMPRLTVTRKLLAKYNIRENVRLYCGDGAKFNVRPGVRSNDSGVSNVICVLNDYGNDGTPQLTKAQRRVARKLAGRKRRLADVDTSSNRSVDSNNHGSVDDSIDNSNDTDTSVNGSGDGWYDRVLVDAECSHDGSIKHILKLAAHTSPHAPASFLDTERLASLSSLQRSLIDNGYRQLRIGGVMVYSTCSFLREQNEDVVEWLLAKYGGRAELMPVLDTSTGFLHKEVTESTDLDSDSGSTTLRWCRGLPFRSLTSIEQRCIRLDPLTSRTSGLFIGKIRKT